MSIAESILIAIVAALLSGAGGLYWGGKGRVSESRCRDRHDAEEKAMLAFRENMKVFREDIISSLSDLKRAIEDQSHESREIHGRITQLAGEVSRLQGRLNGQTNH